MSATWLQALRAYVARTGAPSTLASRHRLYDQIAHVHLDVRRGAHVRPNGLAVLREARWALLRDGTPREKSDLLEHIMKSLALASEVATYDGSAAAGPQSGRNAARRRSGSDHESRLGGGGVQHEKASSPPINSETSSPDTTAAAAQNLSMRHQLLLELVQCLVEAKVAEIPLTARHYRYPLRSPLLAEVSPELPLLLLEELTGPSHQHSTSDNDDHISNTAGQGSPAAAAASSSSSLYTSATGAGTAEWEARVDCGASLAGAGHVADALALCGEDGRMFRAVLQRVARQRRDGWCQAWALAVAVPMERVVGIAQLPSNSATGFAPSPAAAAAYSEDWLRGVLEAVQLRARATRPLRPTSHSEDVAADGTEQEKAEDIYAAGKVDVNKKTLSKDDDESEQLFAWVDQLRQLVMVPCSAPVEDRQTRALHKAQRLVMDAYLSVCPPSRWREAVGVVLHLKAASQRSIRSAAQQEADVLRHAGDSSMNTSIEEAKSTGRSSSKSSENDASAEVVSAGRVMALLQFARQPWMTLLLFYGNPFALLSPSAVAAPMSPVVWSVTNDRLELAVRQLVKDARTLNRLAVASGALLSERDVHHSAVYNHAMAALAATGHLSESMLFYQAIPVACVNAYTHWGVLQSFLLPTALSGTTAEAAAAARLKSASNYELCQRALKRLLRTLSDPIEDADSGITAPVKATNDGDDDDRTFTRDQANTIEAMALWAALRRDADTALLCATHAPPACRYVHLIAMMAAGNSGDASAVTRVVRQLCRGRRTTRKELCLAAAVLAVYFPGPQTSGGSSRATEHEDAYDELTRALCASVGNRQSQLDEVVQLLVDYVGSLQRRRSHPFTSDDTLTALQNVLMKAKVLHSTMDLVRLSGHKTEHSVPHTTQRQQQQQFIDSETTAADWRATARLIQVVGNAQGLSVARAAPALVSAGAPAEVAIDLLPV